MKFSIKQLSTRGDTIVEVLVVLAILGLAIGIAFSTANRGLLDTNEAEENSQASNYVQTQLESLRYLSPNGTTDKSAPNYNSLSNIYAQTNSFCITSPTASSPIVNATGTSCNFGSAPYSLQIFNCDAYTGADTAPCSGTASSSDTFVVVATWPNVLGQGTDSVTSTYRVHSISSGEIAAQQAIIETDAVSAGTCTVNCAPIPVVGIYHWTDNLNNITPESEANEVTGCTWNFNDGTTLSNNGSSVADLTAAGCYPGDVIYHTFPANPVATYPNSCYKTNETTTLTVFLSDGGQPVNTTNFLLPLCY
jgi:prepilin-type N-terminal cleavage/methylation domain-containing protein